MNHKPHLITLIATFFVIALLLGTSGAAAQSGSSGNSPQAAVGTAFTYQGQLRGGNAPGTGSCDMAFRLFDTVSAGNQVGSPITLTVPITNNLFTVNLDFGASPFTGDARWLEIRVKCGSDSGFTTLNPRQALTAAPYALSLMPNTTINGLNNTGNLSFGATLRQMLNLWGTQYGVGVQSYTLYNRTDYGGGFAWYEGGAHSNTQNDPGPFGIIQMLLNSSNGLTVYNKVSASVNSVSPGAAVLGANAGNGYGIYGQSNNGGGVIGESSTSNGVAGVTGGASASGVYGSNTGSGYGVSGTGGLGGVHGITSNSTGGGVYGANNTSSYVNTGGGVVGFANNTNGVVAISINSNPIVALGSNLNDRKFVVANDGNVYADGTYNTPAADFAEMLPAVSGLESGDVLVIGLDGKLTRSMQAYQPTVVGIYSTKPAFVGGRGDNTDPAGKVPLAVVGVVPVKVSAENGAIQPADLLVASATAGHAMRAGKNPPSGTVIGKALGSLKRGTGTIQMLVFIR